MKASTCAQSPPFRAASRYSLAAALLLITAISADSIHAADQAPVDLRSAARFAILAGSAVSSVPTSAIKGDVGLSPGTSVGLTPVEVNGGIYTAGDGGATAVMLTTAKGDLTTAYNDAAGRTVAPVLIPNADLGGRTLEPGLYKSTGTLAVTGILTLDAKGDPTKVFIFQVTSELSAASGSQVILKGGASAANIFWQVGSSAVFGTTSKFAGTIMADQSISFATGATLNGRALARIGGVTLDSTTITVPPPVTAPARPRFGPVHRETPASVSLVITNTPGLALTLEHSTDLTEWKTLTVITPEVTPATFVDKTASNDERRFYRAFYP